MHAGELPTLLVGWDFGQGGAAGRTFVPGATDLGAAFVDIVLLFVVVVAVPSSVGSFYGC